MVKWCEAERTLSLIGRYCRYHILTDGKRNLTVRKYPVGTSEKTREKTELNANEWVDSIDLKVVFHKLLSKSSYLLPGAITGSNLHARKNRKDETFSSQNAIMLYPLDIMFASTKLHVGLGKQLACNHVLT